jgi:hypothetical protein
MTVRKTTIGLIALALGALCALAATSAGMLTLQTVLGVGSTFSVGKASLAKSDRWLLLDHRERIGAPHVKLGFITGQESDVLPQGRYFSFKDVDTRGHVTFFEVDDETSARIKNASDAGLGCQPLSSGKSLVRCQTDPQQLLFYDLNRAFVVGVSPADSRLLERVLAIIAE